MMRRRAMMGAAGPEPDIPVTVTWSGSGADKTSSKIDATDRDLYMTIPFVEGDSRLQTTATASTNAFINRCAALYNDSGLTEFVGYYNSGTGKIVSSRPATTLSPKYAFDREVKIVPRGYYAKLVICKNGTNAFSSNDKFIAYVNAHEVLVLRK